MIQGPSAKSNRLSCGKKETFERLYADSKRYRENKEKLKEKLLAETHQDFTFKPQTSKKPPPQPNWQSTLRNSATYTPVHPQRREQYMPPSSGVTSGKTSEYI